MSTKKRPAYPPDIKVELVERRNGRVASVDLSTRVMPRLERVYFRFEITAKGELRESFRGGPDARFEDVPVPSRVYEELRRRAAAILNEPPKTPEGAPKKSNDFFETPLGGWAKRRK